jgi:acid phosphatase (class A)
MRKTVRRATVLWIGLMAAGCVTTPEPVPEIRPGMLAGYLGKELPDSLALLPPPPAGTDAAFKHDEEVSRASQKLRGTPRYTLATADADLSFPHTAGVFACALGLPITERGSPRLYLLLRRVLTDAGLATYGAKNKYNRVRPFVHFNEGTCAPRDEEFLRKDGSYPSGHTSIGWAWALVLTELAPERRDAVLARGRAFGESRLICNAHWQSDVLEGRAVGAGAVALLHSNPTFKADMEAARREIEAMRAKGEKPEGNCAAEAEALAIKIPGVL